MPEPLHPSYAAGALTTPRQLDRWLDVNSQNGPLGRTQTYVTLAAFDIPVTWRGYSDLLGEYHFESPNNISLVGVLNDTPTNPNYTLCVSYVNSDNTVVRYSLWRASGDVFGFVLTPYTGQMIKKNFRLEIWSTNVSDLTQTTNINIYTSVLGDSDYRYGVDSMLVNSDGLCESQANVSDPIDVPSGNILAWWDASIVNGVFPNVTSWVDVASGYVMGSTSTTKPTKLSATIPPQIQYTNAQTLNTLPAALPNLSIRQLYYLIQIPNGFDAVDRFIIGFDGSGTSIFFYQTSTGFKLNFQGDIFTFAANGSYLIEIRTTPHRLIITNATNGTVVYDQQTVATHSTTYTELFTGAGAGTDGFLMGDILAKDTVDVTDNYIRTVNYLLSKSGTPIYTLPLTWGSCSQPTLNT